MTTMIARLHELFATCARLEVMPTSITLSREDHARLAHEVHEMLARDDGAVAVGPLPTSPIEFTTTWGKVEIACEETPAEAHLRRVRERAAAPGEMPSDEAIREGFRKSMVAGAEAIADGTLFGIDASTELRGVKYGEAVLTPEQISRAAWRR
jgi:hypothetical protein